MQDIATKVEGSQLTAAEFNQIPSELENLITSSGQTLSKDNVNQAATAVAIYAGLGDFYSTSGTADAIILSPVGNMKAPLRYYNGLRVRFIASANNTGIVNIAIQSLSSVSLLNNKGEPLNAGELVTGQEYSATFDGTNFKLFASGSGSGSGGGLEIGDIGFAPLGIDETQNKRRYLNGQVINQAQFTSFTAKLKRAIELHPNLATTEENWQAEIITSVLDQCGKFVIDDALGTIRLPKVVNINGLQDLALIGNIKAESLPNITGATYIREAHGRFQGFQDYTGCFSAEDSGVMENATGGGDTGGNSPRKLILDASLSSSTYQDNAPVQQEAIQYPYFIQVATGVEETVDVTREIELNNPFSLLDYKWSEYEITNASWLLSNGIFHSGATYVSVYELLLKIYNGTETKDGVSVKLVSEEYSDTDFVLNTTDITFRLPVKVKLASGNQVVGNGMTLGLTDGTTGFGLKNYPVYYVTSGSENIEVGTSSANIEPINHGAVGVTTDPLKSGIETSSSGLKLYFYIGETIQDANLINASGVFTALANKIGFKDSKTVVGWGMPDYSTAVSVTAPYTATYPCWFVGYSLASAGSNQIISVNGVDVARESGDYACTQIPLDIGDVVTINAGDLNGMRICAMKGID